MIATAEFEISDIIGDGINDTVELVDSDGNSVGTVDISITFEEGDGTSPDSYYIFTPAQFPITLANFFFMSIP